MPLLLPQGDEDQYFVVGLRGGKPGAPLAAGSTVAVVSADPATILITPDATAQPTKGVTGVPDGTATLASGLVADAGSANVNVPINVTATETKADGTTGLTVTDTVTIVPGLADAIGELFGGTPIVIPPKV